MEAMEQAILDFLRENPQELIASDEEDEDLRAATGERQPRAPTERQTRQESPAINYWDTNWGRLWTNPKTEFGYTKEGKEFRQKLRTYGYVVVATKTQLDSMHISYNAICTIFNNTKD